MVILRPSISLLRAGARKDGVLVRPCSRFCIIEGVICIMEHAFYIMEYLICIAGVIYLHVTLILYYFVLFHSILF